MSGFTVYDRDNAPAGSEKILDGTAARFGFLPNIMGVMAESPAMVEAYATLHRLLASKTSLTPQEIQVLALTIARENGCEYCVAAHTWRAEQDKLSDAAIAAIRDSQPLPDPKLAALSDFAAEMVRARGWLDDAAVERFMAAGYSRANVMDVLVAVAWKTLSTYVNHLADTPLDEAFEPKSWQRPDKAA